MVVTSNIQTFISYKSEYRSFAQIIRDFLQNIGYKPWLDVDKILGGDNFRAKIEEALEESDIIIGIITPEAVLSEEVLTELDFAFSNKKRLLLILHKKSKVPYWLRRIQYIDFTHDEQIGFEKLKIALSETDTTDYSGESPSAEYARLTAPKPQFIPSSQTQSVSKSKSPNQQDDQQDREQILNNVFNSWIVGVLRKNTALGELDITRQLQADAVLRVKDYSEYTLPEGSVGQIFEDMDGQLLILGQPGSGKTILLLQLTEILLGEAQTNLQSPIPLVFNLSSWARKQQVLDDWLIDEMKQNYGIPKNKASLLLSQNRVILLLDGLDEVIKSLRDACVEAINAYRNKHLHLRLVVCSRIADYEVLNRKIDLNGAILLDELTDEQIDSYLSGEENNGLKEVLKNEAFSHKMAKTPFLLSIMKAAYQGAPYTGNPNINLKLPEPTEKLRFNHLFNRYITQHLFNEPPTTYYYLMWLAKHTTENNRTVFNLEELQPSSLPKHLRTRYRWMVGLTIGIIGIIFIGILFGLSGWLLFGVNVGIVLGLVLGLAGGIFVSLNDSLQDIAMIDKISWYLDKQDWAIAGILGTVLGIVTGVTLTPTVGVISGSIFAFLSLAIGGLKSSAHAESRSIPNQGVRNSFVNGLVGGSMMIVLLGVALALAIGWNDDNQQGLKISIIVTLLLGVVLGVIGGPRRTLMGGIFGGLGSLFQHTILRFWLWRGGFAPLNYADFLIHSSELGLLRQVGGGFIFRHRYLQEYFAEEWEKTQ